MLIIREQLQIYDKDVEMPVYQNRRPTTYYLMKFVYFIVFTELD